MKKTPLIFILGLFLALSLVSLVIAEESAEVEKGVEAEFEEIEIPPELEVLQQELVGKKLPGPLGKMFGNQRINFYLEMDGGEAIVAGIIIEKKMVKNIQIAEVSDPTLEIRTSEMVVRSVLRSSAPAATLRKALKEKQITVKAFGFTNKLKFRFASSLASISGFFGKEEIAPVEVVSREEAGMPSKESQEVTGGVVSEGTNTDEEQGKINKITTDVEDTETENTDAEDTEKVVEVSGPKTHTVALITGGFAVPSIEIKVGDTVSWVNDRADVPNKGFRRAMILGTQKCSKAKSGFFMPGESYSWTFSEPSTCLFVDGLYTTQTMKIIVTK